MDVKDEENDVEDFNPSYPSFDGEEDDDEEIDEDLAEHFAEVEKYVSEDPSNSFGDYCGLQVSDFAPEEQLTENDMQIIIKAFEKMSFT